MKINKRHGNKDSCKRKTQESLKCTGIELTDIKKKIVEYEKVT